MSDLSHEFKMLFLHLQAHEEEIKDLERAVIEKEKTLAELAKEMTPSQRQQALHLLARYHWDSYIVTDELNKP